MSFAIVILCGCLVVQGSGSGGSGVEVDIQCSHLTNGNRGLIILHSCGVLKQIVGKCPGSYSDKRALGSVLARGTMCATAIPDRLSYSALKSSGDQNTKVVTIAGRSPVHPYRAYA